jgi:alpha-1,6-mannosyltransferase
MLRTLHFTNAWHPSSGGISTFYRALLKSADEGGWQARLVVPGESKRYEKMGPSSGIYYVRAPRAPFSPDYRVLYPHSYLLPGGAIRQILRKEQPHLVEICDKYTMPYLGGMLRLHLLKEMDQQPAVVGLSCERMHETVTAYTKLPRASKLFARLYMKYLYFPLFDHHIAVSQHAADELEVASHGHKVRRGVWIRGMGVDVECFTPTRRRAEHRRLLLRLASARDNAVLFLYAGRLAPEKNLGLLIDALSRNDGARQHKLLIAGNGPMREAFLSEARRRLPGSVVYLGHLADREALADLYANADIFLHPNPQEPFGIAPLEGMASGMALVAPDSGGVTSYANPSNAWVVPATPERFGAAIQEIVGDPVETARRTRAARLTAEQFSWPCACARFLSLYQDLHQRVIGDETRCSQEPAFYSTKGNWFGAEISQGDRSAL